MASICGERRAGQAWNAGADRPQRGSDSAQVFGADLARLWDAPEELRTLKLRLLAALFTLAQRRSTDRIRKEICDDLFVLAEDWDSSLLSPIVRRAEELCKE